MRILRSILHICVDLTSVVIHPLSRLLSKSQVRILCYHRVCELPETKDSMVHLNVSPASFAQQMAFLSRGEFNVITLEQFIDYRDENSKLPAKTIIITFDDGYGDNYITAFPILKKHNLKATFFVVTDYIDGDEIFWWLKLGEKSGSHYRENKQCWLPLRKQDILDMRARGACFGSHSSTHGSLSDMDEGSALKEINGSREHLEKILSKSVRCFSYPYGKVSKSVKGLVKAAGYKAAVTAKGGSNALSSDFLELRRIPIHGQDSLAKFKRKVEGAYDWWFRYLLPVTASAQRAIFRR